MNSNNTTSVNIDFINNYKMPTTITRRELFDENNYLKIINNGMLDKLTLKKLTNYHKERREAGIKDVTYSVGKKNIVENVEVGRLYPNNGLSGMSRNVRNALTEKFYWDLDFVNAHYHLSLYLCEKVYNIPCINMKTYIENREHWLNLTHPNRKISKNQFLAIAFGGSIKNLDEEFEVLDENIEFERSNEVEEFLKGLKQEFNSLAMAVYADSKYELWKKIKKDSIMLKDQPNAIFKLLSKVLQHIEKEHLLFLSSYLEMRGRYMGVYIHDGGLIEKLYGETQFDENLRIECENAVNTKFGMNMKLLIKPIEYNITELFGVSNIENELLRLQSIDSYAVIKEEFEKTNFFVNDITSACEVEERDEYFDLNIRTKQKLFDRYAPLTYKEYVIYQGSINTTEKPFMSKWFCDKTRRAYKKIDFIPNGNVTNDIFNTFKGLKAESLLKKFDDLNNDYVTKIASQEIENTDSKHLKMLLEHIKNLCGNDETMYIYLIEWLAFIVQKRIQPQTALVFQSKQGTGKDLFWGFVYDYIIGKSMVAIPSDINDIVGRFTGILENKLLVHINEVSGKDTFISNDKIKLLIAGQKELAIENKGLDKRMITNNLGFVFLSNNDNPVRIEESDRRFCVFECSNEWIEKDHETRFKHFKDLAEILTDNVEYAERLGAIFYYLLKNIDLSNSNILNIPKSNAYLEMKKSQLPVIYYWFKALCEKMEEMEEKGKGQDLFNGNDFYTMFNDWKNYAGYSKYEMTNTKFGLKLKDFNFIEKKRSNSGIKYKVDLNKLVEFLRSKDIYDEFTD
jgi:hypothetical protein